MPDVSSSVSISGSGTGSGDDQLAVRLFVGHDRTPLWFPGPRDLDETLLDDELTEALHAWESDWYASRDVGTFEWVSTTPEIEHLRRGVDLARRLALALGAEHVVEVDQAVEPPAAGPGPARLRIRSDGPATQPEAARRFTAWADEERAEHERVRSAARKGWSAYAPRSGATFRPSSPEEIPQGDH